MVEHVATATADAVTLRMLTTDGERLVPVVGYHPDPQMASAIASIMGTTADARSGLWSRVVAERQAHRWYLERLVRPPEASATQAGFIEQFSVRAILGVPLVDGDVVVGGLALFRLGVDRPYTDDDQALAQECAARLAPVMGLRRSLLHP